jgi:Fe-S cluster assembly iron-binding protein IscA
MTVVVSSVSMMGFNGAQLGYLANLLNQGLTEI